MGASSSPTVPRGGDAAVTGAPVLDVVVPVHDEAVALEASIRRLHAYLGDRLPWTAVVTIVDNGSTDGTGELADRLASELVGVRSVRLAERGRGRALRAAWEASTAEIVAYVDVDLSTGLDALLPLVAPLVSGHSDIAIGSRLAHGATVARGARREVVSHVYNLLLRLVGARFTDAQCGFKAVRADVARALLPHIEDQSWFFDTELLLLAEHNGLRIHEVAVDWVDDPDTRVVVGRTAADDLRGLARVLRLFVGGGGVVQVAPSRAAAPDVRIGAFAGIGAVSTVVYLALFLALRPVGALTANAGALAVSAVVNTMAHRRFTFAGRASRGQARLALGLYLVGLACSSAALGLADVVSGGVAAQLVAIVAAGSLVSTTRLIALRALAFRASRTSRA